MYLTPVLTTKGREGGHTKCKTMGTMVITRRHEGTLNKKCSKWWVTLDFRGGILGVLFTYKIMTLTPEILWYWKPIRKPYKNGTWSQCYHLPERIFLWCFSYPDLCLVFYLGSVTPIPLPLSTVLTYKGMLICMTPQFSPDFPTMLWVETETYFTESPAQGVVHLQALKFTLLLDTFLKCTEPQRLMGPLRYIGFY